eukprot:6212764-Pleurochrysis_carterae.AAC.1
MGPRRQLPRPQWQQPPRRRHQRSGAASASRAATLPARGARRQTPRGTPAQEIDNHIYGSPRFVQTRSERVTNCKFTAGMRGRLRHGRAEGFAPEV